MESTGKTADGASGPSTGAALLHQREDLVRFAQQQPRQQEQSMPQQEEEQSRPRQQDQSRPRQQQRRQQEQSRPRQHQQSMPRQQEKSGRWQQEQSMPQQEQSMPQQPEQSRSRQQTGPSESNSHSGRHSRTYRASGSSGATGSHVRIAQNARLAQASTSDMRDVAHLPEQAGQVAAAGRQGHQPDQSRPYFDSTTRRGGRNHGQQRGHGGQLPEREQSGGANGSVSATAVRQASSLECSRQPIEHPGPPTTEAGHGRGKQSSRPKKKYGPGPGGRELYSDGRGGRHDRQSTAIDHGPDEVVATMGLDADREWEDMSTGRADGMPPRSSRAAVGPARYQRPERAAHSRQQWLHRQQLRQDMGSPVEQHCPATSTDRWPDSVDRGRHRQPLDHSGQWQQQNGHQRTGRQEWFRQDVDSAVGKREAQQPAGRMTTSDTGALGDSNPGGNPNFGGPQLLVTASLPASQPFGQDVSEKKGYEAESSNTRLSKNSEPQYSRAAVGIHAGLRQNCSSQERRPSSRQWVQPAESSEDQLEALTNQLWNNSLECMICYSTVRIDVAVWSCLSCYHIFHLFCIKKWASSAATPGPGGSNANELCPACRVSFAVPPTQYLCFCGRMRDPPVTRKDVPHSCGEKCIRKRKCAHGCTRLCHPGPCPACRVRTMQSCQCGKMQEVRSCNAPAPLRCANECGKLRACGRHACTERCHADACPPCTEQLEQVCCCPRQAKRVVPCPTVPLSTTSELSFTCGLTCGRELACGKHTCTRLCHEGPCPPCSRLPAVVTHCPCGRRELSDLPLAKPRSTCTDPIPSCGLPCNKRLRCYVESSDQGEKHICPQLCHDSICGPCKDEVAVLCRCGSELKSVKCSTLTNDNGEIKMPEFVCSKRCNAKMNCSRHKCSRICCSREVADEVHTCLQPCGRLLSCGLHHCDELCHRGQCRTCPHVSFDELHCHCGAEIIYPPVPCGTMSPGCSRPCQRMQNCQHPVMHNCHPDSEPCTPCVALTQKWCVGQHEMMTNVPCFLNDMACGRPCGKPLTCGMHTCTRTCHKGDCLADGKTCSQPCTRPRPDCGHACGKPCHGSQPCPSTSMCTEPVVLKCACGLRSGKVPCNSSAPSGQFCRLSANLLAVKLSQATSGKVLELEDEVYSVPEKNTGVAAATKEETTQRRLKCDEQCSIMERNRRFALALEIENPDLRAKLSVPAYSDFLRSFTTRDPAFVVQIEKALNNLVLQSKQDKRQHLRQLVHSFPPMNSDRRRLVHELAVFYGCTSESQDSEPNKSVVVTAVRRKCWMPSVTLVTAVQKDLHPRASSPVLHNTPDEMIIARASAQKPSQQDVSQPAADTVDYFDVTD